ncbi:unnamed protein product, partial [Symbiodinium sp. CCMP2456]
LKQEWNILKSLNIGDNLDLLIMEPLPTESKVKDARQLALLAKQPVSLKRAKIICGFGSMSLVMESDTSKYGNGLEMRWSVAPGSSSVDAEKVKICMKLPGKEMQVTTIASALKQLKFDVAQANQAVYGHKCTISPTRKIMLQEAKPLVAKGESLSLSVDALDANNAGLVMVSEDETPSFSALPGVEGAASAGSPSGFYVYAAQRSVLFKLVATKGITLEAGHAHIL